MKEDILEQLVDEYLMHQGYFTMHNVKFQPDSNHPDFDRAKDCVPSDIDVLAFNPLLTGPERVIAVSCKSWQEGFDPAASVGRIHTGKKYSGREAWMGHRELVKPKWSRAFIDAVEQRTGSRSFCYWTAVTHVRNDEKRHLWEEDEIFRQSMEGNPIRLISFRDLLDAVWQQLKTTPAASELGRMVQLMKASKWSTP